MKLLKQNNKLLIGTSGKVLKVRPDEYIEADPEVFTFEVEVSAGETFYLPTTNSYTYYNSATATSQSTNCIYNYVVDWGDGNVSPQITTYNSADKSHVYNNRGTYIIKITGTMEGFTVNNDSNIRLYITRVFSWGNVGLKVINFNGCSALVSLPVQRAKLTQVRTFSNFVTGCTSLVAYYDTTKALVKFKFSGSAGSTIPVCVFFQYTL